MPRRIHLMMAAVAVLLLCRVAAEQAGATVVRDGKAAPSNPAVEAGGAKPVGGVHERAPDNISYTLIGTLPMSSPWFQPCFEWPWQLFGRIRWHGPAALPLGRPVERPVVRPVGRSFRRTPRSWR
jgi:hypothetical protein